MMLRFVGTLINTHDDDDDEHFAVYDSSQPGALYPTTTAAIDLAYRQLAPQQ